KIAAQTQFLISPLASADTITNSVVVGGINNTENKLIPTQETIKKGTTVLIELITPLRPASTVITVKIPINKLPHTLFIPNCWFTNAPEPASIAVNAPNRKKIIR